MERVGAAGIAEDVPDRRPPAAGPDEPRLPVTAGGAAWARFTANACEAVWAESEAGAGLYLAIAVTAGTLHYRIAQ